MKTKKGDHPKTTNLKPRTSPALLVIVGETASGKSALAMEMAQRFRGEIIAADSWTVRREVNIGTAKPAPEERARVRHHLLDIVEPCADFTAAVFKRLANAAITDIAARGSLPIMVGGTGLYVEGVIFDFGFLPAADKGTRAELNALSIGELLERIKERGLSLEGIDVRNKRRLIRLLETGGQRPMRQGLRANTLLIGLRLPPGELRQRIEKRVEAMLEAGLENEVKQLADKYGWQCEAMKGIGYREWREYFEGQQSLEATRARIIKSTLELAKRQRTWFKRNPNIQWISSVEEAAKLVEDFLHSKALDKGDSLLQ